MDTSVERQALLETLAGAPSRIEGAARHAAATERSTSARPGWTAREVVAHLAAVEREVFQARLDQLAADESPTWAWVEPGPSASPEAATLKGALELFDRARSATLARIRELDDAAWRHAGVHATYGRLDVAGLLGVAADHDEEHRADLEARAG